MKWEGFVTDYLTFTRKDRIGILVLVVLILLVLILPKLASPGKRSKPATADTTWIALMKKLEQKEPEKEKRPIVRQNYDEERNAYPYNRSRSNEDHPPKDKLFFFDPNTTSPEDWEKLGMREKTIHTIQNYLHRGGHFKKPEDIQRIYGLQPEEYKRLGPFIKIERVVETNKPNELFLTKYQKEAPLARISVSRNSAVDINTSDTTHLIALPGIGSKLAARIVHFRDQLGGFYSIAQVGETFGLPDSTFKKIKQYLVLENISIKKININTITLDELKAHPYIKWSIAIPIIAYRNEHGFFSKVEDLKKVMAVTEELYNKIAPYLSLQ